MVATPCWRSRRGRELVLAGALLVSCVGTVLVLNRVLAGAAVAGRGRAGVMAKPPLDPPPGALLDLPRFTFLLNADPCEDGDVTGMLLVTSHVEHAGLRAAHRRAYPRAELRRLGLRRVFLLARPARQDQDQHDLLDEEARRFNDLVQGDFNEAYRNLTYKHTMGLQWAANYCPQSRFVLKMDDDIVVDLYQLMDFLISPTGPGPGLSSSVLGYALRGLRPSRDPASKWFVTRDEFAAAEYPAFASGWLYATTPGVARALAEGAARWVRRHRYFWIDDLLLTGMVREALAEEQRPPRVVSLVDASALYTVHPELIHCCLAEPDRRCDVLVGPSGGEDDLIVRFQAHAARCHFGQSCRDRPAHRRVAKSCVVRARLGDDRLPGLEGPRASLGRAQRVPLF